MIYQCVLTLHICLRDVVNCYDIEKACEQVSQDHIIQHHPQMKNNIYYFLFFLKRDTSRHLDWIKNVKDFHGSGVMSSFRQVEAILSHGTLTIGRLDSSDGELDISKAIMLTLPDDKELQKGMYTLDELKDLQSKLMLIAGKTSGKKDEVETFNEVQLSET